MTARGIRVAFLFLKRHGDHAVVNVSQHGGKSYCLHWNKNNSCLCIGHNRDRYTVPPSNGTLKYGHIRNSVTRYRFLIVLVFCAMFFALVFFVLCLVYSMLTVSLDCPFWIAPSVFSNVCLLKGGVIQDT